MKLFLIDGHALVFKMYYAFLGRPMVNTKGVDTSILFGFTKYLLELIERERPTHIAVSFDPPGGTFRNRIYPEYKANRGETPEAVVAALEPLTRIVRALDIPVLMIYGFEADDVIGSAARRFAGEGFDVYMVTPDKDYGQLVGEHIFQYKPGKSGSDNEILGPAEVCEKWKISSPAQVVDILALCGDSSDNVPGVQGVGPVGAAKLLSRYGSVESIYEHIEELTERQREMFGAARGHIAMSKELVTIKTDIELDVTVRDLVLDTVYTKELDTIMDEYELPSLKRILRRVCGGTGVCTDAPREEELPDDAQRIAASAKRTLPRLDAKTVAVVMRGGRIFLATDEGCVSGSPEEYRAVLENHSVAKAGAGLKSIFKELAGMGMTLRGRLLDTELMHYLINPERSHSTDVLAKAYFGVDLEGDARAEEVSLFDDPGVSDSGPDPALEAVTLYELSGRLLGELNGTEGLGKLYDSIEEPLIPVLARMELTGVKIDLDSLQEFAMGLRLQAASREAEIRELAGEPGLNVASPKQIGEVVFEKLALDPLARKPAKGSWPTDEQTLSALSGRSPIIGAILDYRGLRKLLSTYIEPFAGYVSPKDGRVHTTFNQALTSTGRLSSSNPNLQNIPIRTDQGKEIRRAFVPGSVDSVIMSADYSQIELRLMAHFCGDAHLAEAFRQRLDVHAATAAKIFRVDISEVTEEQRRIAKTANFGIMYGISSFGLAQRLHCSRAEAGKIIKDYFESFPSIRGFIDETVAGARSRGYVETLFGRRRYIRDINSRNASVRSLAERNAVNAPIQGTAADIIKLAMIAVDKRLAERGLRARMVLQIHDELLLEVPVDEIDSVRELLVSEMEGVTSLSVPLTVECNYGKTWLDAH